MKKIVLVEDDETIQDVINLMLQDDYIVTICRDGRPILDDNLDLPDLFLLDKQLSDMDGLDICRYLKTQDKTRHIPIIIISASHNIEGMAKKAGANDIIEKPFSMSALRRKIATHI